MSYNITDDDFKFIELPNDDFYTIHILTGEWVDTKFQFGSVQICGEEDEDGSLGISFDWTLIEGDESLNTNVEFQNYCGEILTFVITNSLEAKIGEMNDNSINTDNDTTESVE